MFDFLRGKALSLRLRQPTNEYRDWRFGVRTFGYHPATGEHGRPGWASHYEPIAWADILRTLRVAGVGPGCVFTELGCGLGRGMFAAASLGADRMTGVEIVPWLAEGAEANRRGSVFRDRDIRVIEGNAADHPLGATTHVYMFHSFGPDVIEAVFAKARASRRAAGIATPLRLVYANPVCDDTIAGLGWFRPVMRLPARRPFLSSANHYETTIWESLDQA